MNQRAALDFEEHSTLRGRLRLWRPSPRILAAKIVGHGEASFVESIANAIRTCARSGPSEFFFDIGEMPGYDSPLRTELTKVFFAERKQIALLCVLATSPLVAMGVSVANLALGGIVQSYSEFGKFASAVDTSVRRAGVTDSAHRWLRSE